MKTIKESNLRNYKENYINTVMTDAKFMYVLSKIYGNFTQENTNISVGNMTVFIDSCSQILMLPDDNLFRDIALVTLSGSDEIMKRLLKNRLEGKKSYISPFKYEGHIDGKNLKLVTISSRIEKQIMDQLEVIDLNSVNNLRLLFRDLNDIGRMYQELILDAAKKPYVINSPFYQTLVRAESTIHLTHNFTKLSHLALQIRDSCIFCDVDVTDNKDEESNNFRIQRSSKYLIDRRLGIGASDDFYNKITGEIEKIIVKDTLAKIQDEEISSLEETVNFNSIEAYQNIHLSEDTIKDFDLNGKNGKLAMDLYEHIVKVYNKLIVNKFEGMKDIEESDMSPQMKAIEKSNLDDKFKLDIDTLSDLFRLFVKDMTMVDAGRALMTACHIKVNAKSHLPVLKNKVASSCYTVVAPEYHFAYVVEKFSEIKSCELKILGQTAKLNDGDVIDFIDGVNRKYGVYIENTNYTGSLTMTVNGYQVVAHLDIIEVLESKRICPDRTRNTLSIRALEYSMYDVEHFLRHEEVNMLGSFEKFDFTILDKFKKFVLHPVFHVKSKNQKNIKNCIVGIISIDGVVYEVPICKYFCYSEELENVLAGLSTETIKFNYLRKDGQRLDGRTAWVNVQYGKFEQVERRSFEDNSFDIEKFNKVYYKFFGTTLKEEDDFDNFWDSIDI